MLVFFSTRGWIYKYTGKRALCFILPPNPFVQFYFCSPLFILCTYYLLSHTFYWRKTVVLRAPNPPWRRMGCRRALHPAAVSFFKRTVKARGKIFCKRERQTHTHTHRGTQVSWGGDSWAHRKAAVSLLTGMPRVHSHPHSPSVWGPWGWGWQGKQPTDCDESEWKDASQYTLWSLLNTWSLQLYPPKVTPWRWLS